MQYFKILLCTLCTLLLQLGCKTKNGVKTNANVVDITEYGAEPDSSVDILPILTQILSEIEPGKSIFIPKGTYLISGPLLIDKNNVKIYGEGESSIIKFDNSNDWYAHYDNKRLGVFNIVADDITIHDLTFDQNFRGSGKSDGVIGNIGCIGVGGKYLGKPIKTSNITISNCKFYDYYCDAIGVFNAQVTNLTVKNNRFVSSYIAGNWDEAGVKGEQAIGIASGINVIIENNIIEGALDDAIAIHVRSEDVKVINNEITTTGGRILMNGTHNGEIIGNKIRYIQDGGTSICISFENQAKRLSTNNTILVENNSISVDEGVKIKSGIFLCSPGDNILVKNNNIVNHNKGIGTGIMIVDSKWQGDGLYYFGENIIVKNNSIKGFKSNVSKFLNDPKYSEEMRDVRIVGNDESDVEARTSPTIETSPKIKRIPQKEQKAKLSFDIRNGNYNSVFFIPEADMRIEKVMVSNHLESDVSFRLVDVTNKKKVLAKKINTQELSNYIKGVNLKAEIEYRFSIVTEEKLNDYFSFVVHYSVID